MRKNMIKHFYIFRHGQCPLNVSGHIQGQKFNGDLTPAGRLQAAHTGDILKNRQITLIISSPLKRALQTALIVAGKIKSPIWIDKRFIEVNMGVVEGLHISIVEKNYTELYEQWKNNKQGSTRFKGGETKAEVRRRILQALNYYAECTPYRNIAISSHGIAISQMMQYLGFDCHDVPNGAILHLTYEPRSWQFVELIR